MTTVRRTLVWLRHAGFHCEVAESWLPRINRRRDLFGWMDVVGLHCRDRIILGAQCTTDDHLAGRIVKARVLPGLRAWLECGGHAWFFGWSKIGDRWSLRRVALSLQDLGNDVMTIMPPRRKRRACQRCLF